jgi:hypothetical protein
MPPPIIRRTSEEMELVRMTLSEFIQKRIELARQELGDYVHYNTEFGVEQTSMDRVLEHYIGRINDLQKDQLEEWAWERSLGPKIVYNQRHRLMPGRKFMDPINFGKRYNQEDLEWQEEQRLASLIEV